MSVHSSQNFESSLMTTPARELARRRSGHDDIVLLWHPEGDWVEVSVRDVASGASLHLEIAPGNALDAFTHPYAYAGSRTVDG
jgi:hypothetical protein